MKASSCQNRQAKYLLDECIPLRIKEIVSGEHMESREILPLGTSDDVVLEEAMKRGLVVVTRDMGLVLRSINENYDIIYENTVGKRHYIHSELIEQNCLSKAPKEKTKYLLRNDIIVIP